MSTQVLTELPSIQTSGMDYVSVLAELQNIIQNNPNWSDNWNSFESSEAGQMFLQIMSWIADNLSIRQDLLYNEMYLSTAQKKADKIRLLRLIGYQPEMPHSARVELSIELNSMPDQTVNLLRKFSIASDVIASRIPYLTKFKANNSVGESVQWEILPTTSDGTPDYLGSLTLASGSTGYITDSEGNTIYAYQGETKYTELTTSTSDGPYIDLTDDNIAANSIVCYSSSGNKYLKVDSFASSEALLSTNPVPYIIFENDDGSIRVQFPKKSLLGDERLLPAGSTVSIFYRVTEGSTGNIPANYMIGSATLLDDDNNSYKATITNVSDGSGGSDAEELDNATLNAPLTLRTINKAVTAEDFNILMSAYSGMLKSKVYTCSNMPNNFRSYFGRNLNPQEALAYTLISRDYSSIPSDEYNNYPWITLYKVPRLNEKYSFSDGETDQIVTLSKEYYNLVVYESENDTKSFNNGIVIEIDSDFDSSIVANPDNSQFKLKFTTEASGESNFSNIIYSLLGNSSDIYTDLNGNKELTIDTNAHFVTAKSYQTEFENSGVTYKKAYNISNARYIIFSLDNRVEIYIDLFEGGERTVDGDYYIYWDNDPENDIASVDDTSSGAAANRHGILQLINNQIIAIASGNTSNGNTNAVDEYTANNAYQWFGLSIEDPTNKTSFTFDEDYQRLDLILEINDTTYKFPFLPNSDNGLTYQEFVDQLAAHFTNCQYVRKLEDDAWIALDSTTALSDLKVNVAPKYTNDGYAQIYDIYIKTESEDFLVGNTISISYNSGLEYSSFESTDDTFNSAVYDLTHYCSSMVHGLHNSTSVPVSESIDISTLLGTNFPAVDYTNLATLLEDPNNDGYYYLNISSPLTGANSSIHFLERDGYESNFVSNFLEVEFTTNGETQKAFGQKKVLLLTTNAIAGYKTDPYIDSDTLSSLDTDIVAGNLVFENSCIFNNYDFTSLYASYVFEERTSLDIGSVYNNFYYTGDEEADEELKDKIAYLEGTVLDDNGNVSEAKSNYELKLTKNEVSTNNYYAITDNLGAIRSDVVKIMSADITEALPNGALSLNFDGIDEIIDCDLSGLNSASAIISAIVSAISSYSNGSEENEYQDYIDNVSSVATNSYTSINQVYIKNLNKNNGNITINYPGKYSEDDLKAFYKAFFGTNKTNSDFYTLYPTDMFEEENIIYVDDAKTEYYYMPTSESPLIFTYRKISGGKSVPADYYIYYDSEDTNYPYKLVKTENSNFPNTSFYVHFINDRSLLSDSKKANFDEYLINEYMSDKMISGMNLYMEQPYFVGYDIAAIVYYNANYSESVIKTNVENTLKNYCSVENSEIGGYISQALILKQIMNCEGVENVTINYLGKDYTSQSNYPSSTQIDAKFYEILHINTQEENKHGLIFNYEVQS